MKSGKIVVEFASLHTQAVTVVPDCRECGLRPAKAHKRGLCASCYNQTVYFGRPLRRPR